MNSTNSISSNSSKAKNNKNKNNRRLYGSPSSHSSSTILNDTSLSGNVDVEHNHRINLVSNNMPEHLYRQQQQRQQQQQHSNSNLQLNQRQQNNQLKKQQLQPHRMNQFPTSPSRSIQQQQQKQQQQSSPGSLLLTSSPLILSPGFGSSYGFGGDLLGSPSSRNSLTTTASGAGSVGGMGSLSSLKAVFSQFRHPGALSSSTQIYQQLPPPPPLVPGPPQTQAATSSSSTPSNTFKLSSSSLLGVATGTSSSTQTKTTALRSESPSTSTNSHTKKGTSGSASYMPNGANNNGNNHGSHKNPNVNSSKSASVDNGNSESSNNRNNSSSSSIDTNVLKVVPTQPAAPMSLSYDETAVLIKQCDWVDKTLWVSRQVLGGQSVNGFLRATSTVQRIKMQRTRQNNKGKLAAAGIVGAGLQSQKHQQQNLAGDKGSGASHSNGSNSKKRRSVSNNHNDDIHNVGGDDENDDNVINNDSNNEEYNVDNDDDDDKKERIKKEIMNIRTVKKMKTELELGISFCRMVHATVRSILQELDPSLPPVDKLAPSSPSNQNTPHKVRSSGDNVKSSTSNQQQTVTSTQSGLSSNNLTDLNKSSQRIHGGSGAVWNSTLSTSSTSSSANHNNNNNNNKRINQYNASLSNEQQHHFHADDGNNSVPSPGNPSGSTLRKNRKNKLPPNTEPTIDLPEFDNAGRRLCTKKEHLHRLSECLRYRALRKGDVVAARVSSRNLWIVARVVKDYPAADLPLLDFVQLTDANREKLFRDEKVVIRDVEDKHDSDEANVRVERSLVLPLPRSFAEAAEWAQRYKKGSRVYALYPDTTALYTATVLDSTTYARDDDDIIVVRFDGDEPDATGTIPPCHIPARFVTLIPRGLSSGTLPSSSSNFNKCNATVASDNTSVTSTTVLQSSVIISTTTKSTIKKRTQNDNATTTTSNAYSATDQCTEDEPPTDHNLFDQINLDDPLPGLDGFDDFDFDLLAD